MWPFSCGACLAHVQLCSMHWCVRQRQQGIAHSELCVCDLQDVQALFVSDMSSSAMADKFVALQNAAGIKTPLVNPRGSGIKAITLTGWGALAALTALITVIAGGSYFGYRRYVSPDPSYVMVSKSGDV